MSYAHVGRVALLLVLTGAVCARAEDLQIAATAKRDADPARGFHWPYYYHIPTPKAGAKQAARWLLVLPNNTGRIDDDFAVHDEEAKRATERNGSLATRLDVCILKPVFPRAQSTWHLYTHALDRDTLATDRPGLVRLDLQLLAMIDSFRAAAAAAGMPVHERVLLVGFSASGMFVNRFALLHPERVKAASIGSPGGWPIVPIARDGEEILRYPIGVADVEELTGCRPDLAAYAALPLYFHLGDQDDNDSVTFSDGYDAQDRDLVFRRFGKTPVERWPNAERIYKDAGCKAVFRLHPGVGHTMTEEILAEILGFLEKAMAE